MRIAVTGGKGGTGKTTVAVSLAILLGKSSKLLMVDADVECPNVHTSLAFKLEEAPERRPVRTFLPKIIPQRCTSCGLCKEVCYEGAIVHFKGMIPIVMESSCSGCKACQLVCPEDAIETSWKELGEMFIWSYEGIDVLTGVLKEGQENSQPIVRELMRYVRELSSDYEHVIVDTAAGTGVSVARALEDAELILAVTEPTPMGIRDLKKILELTSELRVEAKVILNRSDLNPDIRKRVIDELGDKLVLEIPFSEDVMIAYQRGEPPVKRSELLKERIAHLVHLIS